MCLIFSKTCLQNSKAVLYCNWVIFMKNTLIRDINNYISYLQKTGLWVTVHGKGIGGLLEHNIHENPYCAYVKTDEAAWQKCIACQQKVYKKSKLGSIFGMCHAGVEEYVFFVGDKLFVSISGYGINQAKALERMKYLSEEFLLDKLQLMQIYEHSLVHVPADKIQLETIVKPLCHMLSLLQLWSTDLSETNTKNKLFDSILAYMQRNFMQDITIRNIAIACSCSQSTVTHLFKQYANTTVNTHLTALRIKQAKKLLGTSHLSINEIAMMCGFSNTNYFPTVFKKNTGFTPTEYRNSYQT